MIGSLEEAWDWHEAAVKMTRVMERLGRKHWDALPWEGSLGREDRFRSLEATEIVEKSRLILDELDDLCILLLFSAFEATVRERVLSDASAEAPTSRHPAVLRALESMKFAIRRGSFSGILEIYNRPGSGLIEEVNQVRRYRNWVAHGRRSKQPDFVEPRVAYQRLGLFLARLDRDAEGRASGDEGG